MSNPTSWFAEYDSTVIQFPFLSFRGDLIPVASRPERVVYPGVDGIALWFSGRRGQAISVETSCDYPTRAAANAAFAAYASAIGTKLNLFYGGNFWGPVAVFDVSLKGTPSLGTVVGGINTANGAAGTLLRAAWKIETLI